MFYIFDCNAQIVGNPKGYRTMRGAMQQASSPKSPVCRALWAAADALPSADRVTVWSIRGV
jgi:hypothetical protein